MGGSASQGTRSFSRLPFDILLFAAFPAFILLAVAVVAYRDGVLGFDFMSFNLPAARAVAEGHSPYPAYEYPPLVAFALVPLTFVPGPNIVFAAILIACVPASLWFLGVRDWRCYGAVFLWAPVLAAVQTSNVTIPLLLGTSICWYARDRWKPVALAGGLTVAAKLLTAPLVVWLIATRRVSASIGVAVVAAGVSAVLWSVIGFAGAADYPSNISTIARSSAARSYTLKVVLEDIGVGAGAARAGWALVALAVVGSAAVLGRRGDDHRSFALAVASMIVAVPVVWLHSFALMIAPVAVMRPRLGAAWLVPILMIIGPGTGNGELWQTAGMLVLMAVTLGLALIPRDLRNRRSPAEVAGSSH